MLVFFYYYFRESREKINCDGHRIGSRYKKALYRGFTDGTFKEPLPTPPWAGILGPVIRAEVGDVLYIHFRNMAKVRNFSVHPHGMFYFKNSEGNVHELSAFQHFRTICGIDNSYSKMHISKPVIIS